MRLVNSRDAKIYPLIYSWKKDDLPYWEEIAKKFSSPKHSILELGFGTGRIGIHLARCGYQIVGIDFSDEMLSIAREKIREESVDVQQRIKIVTGDMRHFKLDEKFQLILIGFNSFLHLLRFEDQITALNNIKFHLTVNGILAIDIFNPDFSILHNSPQWIKERDINIPESDYRVIRDMTWQVNTVQQIIDLTFRVQEMNNGEYKTWLYDEKITYIFPRELKYLLQICKYKILNSWGSYNFQDLNSLDNPTLQLIISTPE